jgi:hypothetical protein
MTAQVHAESGLTLERGLVVADKYRLLEPAGEGAMGSVWKAEHTTLGHTVAVKFLHGSVAKAAEPRARFEREARLAANLGEASRHITRVSDHGVTPDGTPFLVMEFLHGEGLEVRLKRDRRLPIALVAKITAQLSRALHVAHTAGVIHRDLKPANVFLCESPDDGDMLVKLLDFGVAKATLDHDENQATRAGALVGTPNYMSPEQITGETLDARSDLWALAAIVYRMAVGRAPFGSGALSELAMRIVATEPPTPSQLAPDLPHEFDLWVKKGLAKKTPERFQSARDLADSLSMVAGISASGSTGSYSAEAAERLALQLGDSVAGLQHTLGHSAAGPALVVAEPKKKRSIVGIALLAVLLGVAGGVGIYTLRMQQAAPPPTPAATQPPAPVATEEPKPIEAKPIEPAEPAPPKATAEASAPTTTATAKKVYVAPKTTTTAVPKATAEAAPPPPPPPEATTKPSDLWKKKDEM